MWGGGGEKIGLGCNVLYNGFLTSVIHVPLGTGMGMGNQHQQLSNVVSFSVVMSLSTCRYSNDTC